MKNADLHTGHRERLRKRFQEEGVGEKTAAFLSMIPQVTRRYFHNENDME